MSQEEPSSSACCRCLAHLTITRPVDSGRRTGRDPDELHNLHGTTIVSRPIRGAFAGQAFLANSWALPLADQSCESIHCLDVLEYVRDDEAMIAEFARILRLGGTLRLRVPNAGPLAGLDAFNLYRYLTDITHRGRKPVETDDIGWRRHYSPDDLMAMFGARFAIRSITWQRVGVAELANAVCLALFRWCRNSDRRYRQAMAIVRQVERIENRIRPGRIGTVITVEAVRQHAIGGAGAALTP